MLFKQFYDIVDQSAEKKTANIQNSKLHAVYNEKIPIKNKISIFQKVIDDHNKHPDMLHKTVNNPSQKPAIDKREKHLNRQQLHKTVNNHSQNSTDNPSHKIIDDLLQNSADDIKQYGDYCKCGTICYKCTQSYLEISLKDFTEGNSTIEEIYFNIMKKLSITDTCQIERDLLEEIITTIISSNIKRKNIKKNTNTKETQKHHLSSCTKLINKQRDSFDKLISDMKDRSLRDITQNLYNIIATSQKNIMLLEQKIAIMQWSEKNAMSLAIEIYESSPINTQITSSQRESTDKNNTKIKTKQNDIKIISEDLYTKTNSIELTFESKKQKYTKKEEKRRNRFEKKLLTMDESDEVVKYERENFEHQLKTEREKFENELQKARIIAAENELRFKFEKIELERKHQSKEIELHQQITALQRELIDKSIEKNKAASVTYTAEPVGLPLDAKVNYELYGVRVYLSDKYPNHVWRNGKWYRKTPNIKFDVFKSVMEARHEEQITDDYTEYLKITSRIFYYPWVNDYTIIFDPITNNFYERKNCHF